jgi:hypothetical protein
LTRSSSLRASEYRGRTQSRLISGPRARNVRTVRLPEDPKSTTRFRLPVSNIIGWSVPVPRDRETVPEHADANATVVLDWAWETEHKPPHS